MPYKNRTYKEYQHEYYLKNREKKREYYLQYANRYYKENRCKIRDKYFCNFSDYQKTGMNIIDKNIKININD